MAKNLGEPDRKRLWMRMASDYVQRAHCLTDACLVPVMAGEKSPRGARVLDMVWIEMRDSRTLSAVGTEALWRAELKLPAFAPVNT